MSLLSTTLKIVPNNLHSTCRGNYWRPPVWIFM